MHLIFIACAGISLTKKATTIKRALLLVTIRRGNAEEMLRCGWDASWQDLRSCWEDVGPERQDSEMLSYADILLICWDVKMMLRSCWDVERCVVKIMLRWWDAKIFLRWCWNVERFWYDEMLWDLRCWDVERFWDDKMLWDLRCWYVLEIIRRMLRC